MDTVEIFIRGKRVLAFVDDFKIADHKYKSKNPVQIVLRELRRYDGRYNICVKVGSMPLASRLQRLDFSKAGKKSRNAGGHIADLVNRSSSKIAFEYDASIVSVSPRNSNKAFNKRERSIYGDKAKPIDRTKILSRDKHTCYLCGLPVTLKPHVDHILPIGVGPQGYNNLACTCSTCNVSKSNKLPHELPEAQRTNLEKKWAELNGDLDWRTYIN